MGSLGEGEDHQYDAGKCKICGQEDSSYIPPCATHDWDSIEGKCKVCGEVCEHNSQEKIHNCQTTYETTRCTECKYIVNTVDTGVKGECNYGTDNKCTVCGGAKACTEHTWDTTNYNCSNCKTDCPHTGGTTTVYTCKSNYETKLCADCTKLLDTVDKGVAAEHKYEDGKCTVCELPEPCEVHTWNTTTYKCDVCGEDCPHAKYEIYEHNCSSEYDIERCEDCHFVKNREHTGFGDHDYKDGKCTICGKDQPEPCEKHDWDWTIGKCKVCDTYCENHDNKTIYPDCTEGGYITHKCKICGYSTVENTPAEPGNHTYGTDGFCKKCGAECKHESTTTDISSTCTEAGKKTKSCKICKKVLAVENYPALGHLFKDGVCKRCGAKEEVEPVEVYVAPTPTQGTSNVPKTGDNTNLVMPIVTAMIAFAGMIVVSKKRNKV